MNEDSKQAPADFYTGLVAKMYRHLRSEEFDPDPYARFVRRYGEPALELGCGDGDPLLDLVALGLEVDGLDASPDMLARCRTFAAERQLEVNLHLATFETMNLGKKYRSIYFAGATFCLLGDDEVALAALKQIAAHLEPGGAALVPLWIPGPPTQDASGNVRAVTQSDGSVMTLTTLSTRHDAALRLQTTRLRYELSLGHKHESVERDWIIHWFDQPTFQRMAESVGLRIAVFIGSDGHTASADDEVFTAIVQLA